ncbi:hypothetical protein D9O36_14385 [Zobellia amurskyensis]|uniref:Dihydrolipoamide dehydrogenase n=1 Tax=Zobellia amurskyensis TaxID=248905 RepID=A0A7X3D2E7_9FLAO|nr:hypothetical protein [Zobellia amurskyensis]MUH37036.1 hypothetical protein [Zobellia amurskyensis]
MKKSLLLLGTFFTLFFTACEGPTGPPGFDGRDGIDGAAFEAAAFEIDIDLSLNSDLNRYEFLFELYPSDITLRSGDAILIYRLEEVVNGTDVWRQLPQPFFSDEGLLYYNFDFTQGDYSIFVEPEFDASLVQADFVQNQIFRIVIVPTDFRASVKIDNSNITNVMSSLGLTEKDVKKTYHK